MTAQPYSSGVSFPVAVTLAVSSVLAMGMFIGYGWGRNSGYLKGMTDSRHLEETYQAVGRSAGRQEGYNNGLEAGYATGRRDAEPRGLSVSDCLHGERFTVMTRRGPVHFERQPDGTYAVAAVSGCNAGTGSGDEGSQ